MSSPLRRGSLVRSRYFPSSFASAATFAASRRGSPDGVVRRNRSGPGWVEITPRSSARFVGVSRSEPSIIASNWAMSRSRVAAYRSAASGLWQTTNRSCSPTLTSLTPQVLRHLLVAALTRQGGRSLRRAGAQLLPEDVAVRARRQVATVGCGGEPAVGDPDHPAQGPVPQLVFDLAVQRRVGGVTRPAPHPHRDPLPRDGHPHHHLREVVAGVPGLAVRAGPHLPRGTLRRHVAVRVAVRAAVRAAAVLV